MSNVVNFPKNNISPDLSVNNNQAELQKSETQSSVVSILENPKFRKIFLKKELKLTFLDDFSDIGNSIGFREFLNKYGEHFELNDEEKIKFAQEILSKGGFDLIRVFSSIFNFDYSIIDEKYFIEGIESQYKKNNLNLDGLDDEIKSLKNRNFGIIKFYEIGFELDKQNFFVEYNSYLNQLVLDSAIDSIGFNDNILTKGVINNFEMFQENLDEILKIIDENGDISDYKLLIINQRHNFFEIFHTKTIKGLQNNNFFEVVYNDLDKFKDSISERFGFFKKFLHSGIPFGFCLLQDKIKNKR